MTSIQRTLLCIAIFLTLAIGSFIWFVASWDKTQTKTLGRALNQPTQSTSLFILPHKLRGFGGWPPIQQRPQTRQLT